MKGSWRKPFPALPRKNTCNEQMEGHLVASTSRTLSIKVNENQVTNEPFVSKRSFKRKTQRASTCLQHLVKAVRGEASDLVDQARRRKCSTFGSSIYKRKAKAKDKKKNSCCCLLLIVVVVSCCCCYLFILSRSADLYFLTKLRRYKHNQPNGKPREKRRWGLDKAQTGDKTRQANGREAETRDNGQ